MRHLSVTDAASVTDKYPSNNDKSIFSTETTVFFTVEGVPNYPRNSISRFFPIVILSNSFTQKVVGRLRRNPNKLPHLQPLPHSVKVFTDLRKELGITSFSFNIIMIKEEYGATAIVILCRHLASLYTLSVFTELWKPASECPSGTIDGKEIF